MAEVIRMPRMSDTMEEGNILVWHKKLATPSKLVMSWPKWRPTKLPWTLKAFMMALYYTSV